LFSLLGRSHELHVTEHFSLCDLDTCRNTAASKGRALDELIGDAWHVWTTRLRRRDQLGIVVDVKNEVVGPVESERFHEFVRGIRTTSSPSLHFIHTMLPHARWQYLPSGQRYNDPDPNAGLTDFDTTIDGAWTGPEVAKLARQRHVLQTMYVDRLVGEMLDALQESGRLDDTAVVVTGDHGVAFEPGQPQRMLTPANESQIA
jgi:hypothetical protein